MILQFAPDLEYNLAEKDKSCVVSFGSLFDFSFFRPTDQGAYTCEAINVKGRVLATPDCIVRIVGVAESQTQPPTLPPPPRPSVLCNKAGTDADASYGPQCQCKVISHTFYQLF